MNNKVHVLSTAQLDQPLIDMARKKGVELDCLPLIHVTPVVDKDLISEMEELCLLPLSAAFTSANAVNAISDMLRYARPDWKIYCTANATKAALLEYFDISAIKGIANDAAALAEVILKNDVSEVVFFCGDKRMDTLPDILRANQVMVHEMVVYNMIKTPQLVAKKYDGILFFSPSGADSFFSLNKIGTDTVLFAVGNTTADAIGRQSDNKVITSGVPSKEQVVMQAVQYFHKQAVQ